MNPIESIDDMVYPELLKNLAGITDLSSCQSFPYNHQEVYKEGQVINKDGVLGIVSSVRHRAIVVYCPNEKRTKTLVHNYRQRLEDEMEDREKIIDDLRGDHFIHLEPLLKDRKIKEGEDMFYSSKDLYFSRKVIRRLLDVTGDDVTLVGQILDMIGDKQNTFFERTSIIPTTKYNFFPRYMTIAQRKIYEIANYIKGRACHNIEDIENTFFPEINEDEEDLEGKVD